MPATIHPVILCGGSGSRLWPLSRKARPKPFLPLIGDETLFRQAVARTSGKGFAEPIIVAGSEHVDLIESQIGEGRGHRIVVEPAARNTAPAIALAAALLPDEAVMLVCPSDHHIADANAFADAARTAAALAAEGWLVAFGIAPTRAETGYGYIQRGEALPGGYRIARFVEKPDEERAEAYLASGDFSWNGGIFVMQAGQYLAELETHRPAMAEAVRRSVSDGRADASRFHPASDAFEAIEGESIDYAVMENAGRAAMVPVDMGWSDIGSWASLQDAMGEDATRGAVDLDRCSNVLAITDGPRISAVGLEDVCIVVSDGEVLVTTRDGAQRVGKLPGARGL